jgi:hypothetical protein
MNLGEMRAMTRIYLNEPTEKFWLNSELNTLLNVGAKKLYNFIRNMTQYHYTTRVTFQTVPNQAYYKLPADHKSVKLLARIEDNSQETFLTFNPWPHPDNWTPQSGFTLDAGLPQAVWIVGDSLRLVPVPASVLTLRLYYEAKLVELTDDQEIPAADGDYHDMPALWAAINARAKESWDATEIKNLYTSRENDCQRDMLTRLPASQQEVESYLEG